MKLNPVDVLNVSIHLADIKHAVGRLALYRGQIFFEYNSEFLNKRIEISPFKLPLQQGAITSEEHVFEGHVRQLVALVAELADGQEVAHEFVGRAVLLVLRRAHVHVVEHGPHRGIRRLGAAADGRFDESVRTEYD